MRARRVLAVALAGLAWWAAVGGGVAQAHPLGNFTVNHYAAVTLFPDRVEVTAVVDRAEIPSAQALQTIAPDGTPSAEQLAAAAASECPDVAAALTLTVDGRPVTWQLGVGTLDTVPGAAGLPTLRLSCPLQAEASLDRAAEVSFDGDYLPDRIGWREVTADGEGVRLIESPVPDASISDELRSYPDDLLASPVDVRSFTVETEPGENTGAGAAISSDAGDPFSGALASLDRWLEQLIGDRGLTPLVGTLAVVLAMLLGTGHALLPGHGKTVMAAYLAARDGRRRDAITVGVTVTATHTVGVLALGLALSISSTLAGDQVIRWLGFGSGLLVAGIGVFMLRSALPRWRSTRDSPARLATAEVLLEPALVGTARALAPTPDAVHADAPVRHHDHDQPHEHPHDHDHPQDHGHGHDHGGGWWAGGHTHGPTTGRSGLIGMGIAGGLVPSPSALIVLLASIGLGRTVFGVALVIAYGLGMALTLTAVGFLLVRLRGRMERHLVNLGDSRWLSVLVRAAPVLTASLVFVVGGALVVRALLLGG